ncbi:MAG: hypothetical protein ACLTSX_00910 [Collinsella sp.]
MRVQVNLHLPHRVVVITQHSARKWSAVSNPTPLDRPMMEAFCFRPTGTKPFGQSRITPAVRYYVDEVQRTLRYMAVSGALYATPKDILTGVTEDQLKAMSGSKFSVMGHVAFHGGAATATATPPDYKRLQAASLAALHRQHRHVREAVQRSDGRAAQLARHRAGQPRERRGDRRAARGHLRGRRGLHRDETARACETSRSWPWR